MPSSNAGSFLIAFSYHDLISPTGFKVLPEAERTAALYDLLQHPTQCRCAYSSLSCNKWPGPTP